MRIPAGMLWSVLAMQARDFAQQMFFHAHNPQGGASTRTRIAQAPYSNKHLYGRQNGTWRGR